MTIAELSDITAGLADATKEYITRAFGGFPERLTNVEERIASVKDGSPGPTGPVGPKGDPGERGQTGSGGDVGARGEKGDQGLGGPVGPKGDPGERGPIGAEGSQGQPGEPGPAGPVGLKGDVGDVGPSGMPGHEGAAGAPGSAGERGIQGEVGPKGDQGERGANAPPLTKDQIVDALATMTETLEAFVVKHLTAHPPAAGSDGAAGAAGRDGVGLAGALLNHKGELVLTLSDGTIRELGLVVGRDGAKGADGADGKDGADGLGFDDLQDDLEDGGRVIVRRYSRGEQVKEFRHRTALTIYRNVWKDGTAYERGDVVSYGGSTWHANEQTTARPGGTAAAARAWTLMVKEGRQGKDGKGLQGPVGPAGPKGDPGNGRY